MCLTRGGTDDGDDEVTSSRRRQNANHSMHTADVPHGVLAWALGSAPAVSTEFTGTGAGDDAGAASELVSAGVGSPCAAAAIGVYQPSDHPKTMSLLMPGIRGCILAWLIISSFFLKSEIGHFWGLDGPGGPVDPSERWGPPRPPKGPNSNPYFS